MNRFIYAYELKEECIGSQVEVIDEYGKNMDEIDDKAFYEVLEAGNMLGGPILRVQKIKNERIENILKRLMGKTDLSKNEVESQLNIDLTVDSAFWALYHNGYIIRKSEKFSLSEKGKEYLATL